MNLTLAEERNSSSSVKTHVKKSLDTDASKLTSSVSVLLSKTTSLFTIVGTRKRQIKPPQRYSQGVDLSLSEAAPSPDPDNSEDWKPDISKIDLAQPSRLRQKLQKRTKTKTTAGTKTAGSSLSKVKLTAEDPAKETKQLEIQQNLSAIPVKIKKKRKNRRYSGPLFKCTYVETCRTWLKSEEDIEIHIMRHHQGM